jgi:hypothetical protein
MAIQIRILDMAKYTYDWGFSFESSKAITTKDIVSIIDELELSFGHGYEFVPEAITEGGIRFNHWPGKKDGEYKTIRIHAREHGDWPWIADEEQTAESWRNGPPSVIWVPSLNDANKRLVHGQVFYKAFYGAPVFKKEEVVMIMDAFQTVGIVCDKTKTGSLVTYGDLGNPRR